MAKLLALVLTSVVALTSYPALADNGVPTIMPMSKELLLKVGTTQNLNCTVNTSDTGILHWTYPGSDKSASNVKVWSTTFQSEKSITLHSTLQITNFGVANSGVYKCRLQRNNTYVDSEISLIAVGENKTEPKFVDGETSANLSCSIDFESDRSITDIVWLKVSNKSSVRTEELLSGTAYKQENTSLTIINPKIDNAGLYIARFTLTGEAPNTYNCEVAFEAAPQVQNFENAKNLIEGEKMELKCIVKGYPLSDVTWHKDNNMLNISEDSRHKVQVTFGEQHIVSLLVQKVEFEDAGDYSCKAYSALFNETSEKTLTVRVKDKLAALWPFLGIVGEVVVLCTIIFIYEQRRNKQVQQEEKAAEEVDGSATDKKDGLRHRNTNPSA